MRSGPCPGQCSTNAGTPAFLAGPLLISGALDEPGFPKAFALGRKLKQR
jgi:hypothetical protein